MFPEINNKMKEEINDAIKANIEFESIMDKIDFNSYLPEDDDNSIINVNPSYKIYSELLHKADECLKRFKPNSNSLIKSEKENSVEFLKGDLKSEEKVTYVIYKLFETKKLRLAARKTINHNDEKVNYENGTNNLQFILDQISFAKIKKTVGAETLFDNYNWAKVLIYNELSICYSGVVKSSMSLAYAEEAVKEIEKIYPEFKHFEKNDLSVLINRIETIKPANIVGLYTLALINKGEAERLLHEDDRALRTFRRVIEIRKGLTNGLIINNTDSNFALLREAIILNDKGRSKEAISCLNEMKLYESDYWVFEKDIETAHALIDIKEYEDAWGKIKSYLTNDSNRSVDRKAKIASLRLLNEYRKNRSEDFKREIKIDGCPNLKKGLGYCYSKDNHILIINLSLSENDKNEVVLKSLSDIDRNKVEEQWKNLFDIKNENLNSIKHGFQTYEKEAKKLIDLSIERKDGDCFKDACSKLAELYSDINIEKSLKCYYLYLFEDEINSEIGNIKIKKEDFLGDSDLYYLLQKYNSDSHLSNKIEEVEDEVYLKNFFSIYIKMIENLYSESTIFPENTLKIDIPFIEKLKEVLDKLYYQKDKIKNQEEISFSFEKIKALLNKIDNPDNPELNEFIENSFLKNDKYGLRGLTISNQMKRNTSLFIKKVFGRSKARQNSNDESISSLTVLRRWNSFTPTLSSSINQSKGGGYFFRFFDNEVPFGIVIDPGFNFLENFFSQGFKIGDIDMVLISHTHPDHTADLASILSLLHEANGRLGQYGVKDKENKRNITLVLSLGVFEQYYKIIKNSNEDLKDIIVVDREEDKQIFFNNKIIIKSFHSQHKDLSDSNSLGFIITAGDIKLGYTGDIKWSNIGNTTPKYLKYFNDCSIICVHLGSIINILDGKNFCNTFCKNFEGEKEKCSKFDNCRKFKFIDAKTTASKLIKQAQDENHLYLSGLILFFNAVLINNKELKLAIISEFGEELKHGIRIDLYEKFNKWFEIESEKRKIETVKCLPGDIGLDVDVSTSEVYCQCCKRFVDRNEIEPVAYGKEEAICYICNECKEVLSQSQIDQMLKEYCENGQQIDLV